MEITNLMIEQSYNIAKKVYGNEIGFLEGAQLLIDECNMNDNSAKGYINVFRYLRNGERYKRTMNGYATKYYLQNIFNDYGLNALQIALHAVELHIEYYENLKHTQLNNIREIYNEFKNVYVNIYNEFNDENDEYYIEGKAKQVLVNIYERDKNARKKCLEHYGFKCFTCGLLLKNIYGKIAENFIHVHHIIELSSIGKEYILNPITDLRPLCPNCHTIIHRKIPALSIDELIEMIHSESINK